MALTRGGFRHYDYDRMVVWKWHAQFSCAAMDDLDGSTGRHPSPHRRCVPFAVRSTAVVERTMAVCRTVTKSTASQLRLWSVAS